jgi:hypothetical protein
VTAHAPSSTHPGSVESASQRARARLRAYPLVAVATLALVAAGLASRLVQYLSGRSLWLDESFLWLNLSERSPRELLSQLDFAQGAPLPFLLVEKGMIALAGDGEGALRLVPLLAGIAGVGLVAVLAWRLLGGWEAVVAVGLVALSDHLVYYSAEAKQYSLDLAVAAGLLLLGTWAAARPVTAGRAAILAVAGALAVWLSDPAAFVLAGVGGALLARTARGRNGRELALLGAGVAAWLASFAVVYLVHVRDLDVVRDLATGGGDRRPAADLADVLGDVARLVEDPLGVSPLLLVPAVILVVLGLVALCARGSWIAAGMLGIPVAAAVAAVMLGRYPLGAGRFGVFLTPALALLAGAGVGALRRIPHRGAPLAAAAGAALLLAGPAWGTARLLVAPVERFELEAVVAHVAAHRHAGDAIYLYAPAQYPFAYYGPRHGIAVRRAAPGDPAAAGGFGPTEAALSSGDGVVVGRWSPELREQVGDVERLRGRGRTWLVFTQPVRDDGVDVGRLMVARAASFGTRLDEVRATGAYAVLMDLR